MEKMILKVRNRILKHEDVRFFPTTGTNDPFALMLTGISYCDGTYQIERSGKDVIVLEYIVKGTGTVIVNGKTYTASRGDIYIINKGTTHRYFSRRFFSICAGSCRKR